MGTRSSTKFISDGKSFANLFGMWDGDPSGHGKDLAEFISEIQYANSRQGPGTANGIHCLAAQVVAHFKTEPGGFYLLDPDQDEEWNYDIVEGDETGWGIIVFGGSRKYADVKFFGTPQELLDWIASKEVKP
jgi:hypothetical protein